MEITEKLFELKDEAYWEFHRKLIPNVKPDNIIGVRTPDLKIVVKSLNASNLSNEFIKNLPHKYYEENNLHAYLIADIKDFDKCIKEIDRFLPFIDNWATCDILSPKCFKSKKDRLIVKIREWLKSKYVYTVRFAIKMLMTFYLEEEFSPEYLELVAKIKSDEYYVNMMIAWYFATALAKQYLDTVKFLENNKLSIWVHNKTIQKAIESFRITDEKKDFLRQLKRR